jgi:hypothetical protein
MHPHLRTAAAVALLALTVAACGASTPTASPSASAAAQVSTPPSVAPSTSAPAATTPAVAASPSDAASDSPAPSASAAPTRSLSPAEQSVADLLPAQLGTIKFTASAISADQFIDAQPEANKGLIALLESLGISSKDLIVAFDLPETPTQLAISIGAYRFTGADPAILPDRFIKANLGAQPGSTVEEREVAGQKLKALIAPPGDTTPPVYLVFKGDTVFVLLSSDETILTEAVKAVQ